MSILNENTAGGGASPSRKEGARRGEGRSHLDRVRNDEEYSRILAEWDSAFYAKFIRTMQPAGGRGRVLDVGCGVGQVVAKLREAGCDAEGVDVAEANIAVAKQAGIPCEWYDGRRLPFEAQTFDGVGALNVVEHVEEPEAFLAELARVTRPGGRIVISSPNFLRVFGWRDYHPRMRGIGNKLRNARGLFSRWRRMRRAPAEVLFERMAPIIKEPFTPDDDAIVATNALDFRFFLERLGCDVLRVECTDRDVPGWLDWALNFSPLKYGMFNAFVVAEKRVGGR